MTTGSDAGAVAGRDTNITGHYAAGRDIVINQYQLAKRDIAPFNAPPDIREFTDREDEFGRLEQRLTGSASSNVTVCLYGQSGVGKTALATRLLHHLLDRFPGGVLFAQLETEGAQPPETAAILSDFLYLLG